LTDSGTTGAAIRLIANACRIRISMKKSLQGKIEIRICSFISHLVIL